MESFDKIETEMTPTCCLWYPCNGSNENYLMVADSGYKIKLYHVESNHKTYCKSTSVGPTFGGPLLQFNYLNITIKDEVGSSYVAYITESKIIGIIRLPLTGNYNNSFGVIGHCDRLSDITSSGGGRMIFTSGQNDFCVNFWEVNSSFLEDNTILSASTKNPLD